LTQVGQSDLSDKPDTWGASHTDVSDTDDQPGENITILEKSSQDFAKREADTRAQEVSDQKTSGEDMQTDDIRTSGQKRQK